MPEPATRRRLALGATVAVALTACTTNHNHSRAPTTTTVAAHATAVRTIPGMPTVADPANLYSNAALGNFSPAVSGDLARVYVPDLQSDRVDVIDPATFTVVDRFAVGPSPQHIVPSYDLQTLWVTNNAEGRTDGSLTPINPHTGRPGPAVAVDDPYNLYFTPDGAAAIVVAEARKRLDFRDPHTMALQMSLPVPDCAGVNHADFSEDGRYAIFTCEYAGALVKIDIVNRRVIGYLHLSQGGMPQDIRVSPDGTRFYVAEMMRGGVYTVDGDTFSETGFIPTGIGTHGLYPSRDATRLFISNRGSTTIPGKPNGPGSISVLDCATNKVVNIWPIPGGGSPDMGNISADGTVFWVSGRYDNVVYAINTTSGALLARIAVGVEPHGLAVWPLPGRYSLGHTGIMR
jgi:YVTN family beta-propeller protein